MAAVGSKRQTSLAASLLDPIPANRLFGLRVLAAEDGHAEVGMDVSNEASNVIGSLHSSGLVALVDAAGLAAIISVAASDSEFDGVVPLGSVAHLDFLAPARGRLTAHCRLAQTDRHALGLLLRRRSGLRLGVPGSYTLRSQRLSARGRGPISRVCRALAVCSPL